MAENADYRPRNVKRARTFDLRVVGCKVNQVEAEMLAALLEKEGWQRASEGQAPDVALVHTCTVTRRADRDSRKHIQQLHALYPQARIAVSGCLAELESGILNRMPGVAWVIKQAGRRQVAETLNRTPGQKPAGAQNLLSLPSSDNGFFQAPQAFIPRQRARAFVKIQDGCDGVCAYCRVRLARGKPLSRPENEVLDEVRARLDAGCQEIVLTGVNLGCWQPGLETLLPRLAALEGGFRIRFSSLEPQHLTPALCEALAQAGPRWCPHLHLPLQSGDNGVLAAMGRTYSAGDFLDRVQQARAARPDLVVTGDIIVGFPGESRLAFEQSRQVAEQAGFSRAHVFSFSARPGTPAADLPNPLTQREITARARELRIWSHKRHQEHLAGRIGKRVVVLLETRLGGDWWEGTTETHDRARIEVAGRRGDLAAGRVQNVEGDKLVLTTKT